MADIITKPDVAFNRLLRFRSGYPQRADQQRTTQRNQLAGVPVDELLSRLQHAVRLGFDIQV